MNRISKMFFLGLAVVALAGFGKVGVTKAAAQPGSLIKMNGLSSVYYLGADGKRYVFPNQTTYNSWYKDFSGVVTISQSELESYPLGSNVTMRPGTYLVKITTNPKVYAVEPGGLLRAIPDEAAAKALYGDNWAKRVVDVPDAFFTNYRMGTTLAAGEIPAGTLVKNPNNPDVYYFDGTNYRKIADETAFNANRFRFDFVLTISTAITASGNNITTNEFGNPDSSATGQGTQPGQGTGLTVALSTDTPASQDVPQGVAVPVLRFNVTASNDGDIVINGIKFTAIGLGNAQDIDKVAVFNNNNRLNTSARDVDSNKEATINFSQPFTVSKGNTATFEVRAQINGTAKYGLSIAKASDVFTSATVSGSFPMNGNIMSGVNVTVGRLTIDKDGTTLSDVKLGDKQGIFAKFKLSSNDVEDITLNAISFKKDPNSSASDDDVENLSLYLDGTVVATAPSITNRFVTFALTNPITINKNTENHRLVIKADAVGGAGKNLGFKIDAESDVVATGNHYGYQVGVAGTAIANDANLANIKAGEVTIEKVNATNDKLLVDVDNQEAGTFKIRVNSGKNVELSKFVLTLDTNDGSGTTAAPAFIENIELYNKTNNTTYDLSYVATSSTGSLKQFKNDSMGLVLNSGVTNELVVRFDTKIASAGKYYTASIKSASTDLTLKELGNDTLITDITPNTVELKKVTVLSSSAEFSNNALASIEVVTGSTDVVTNDFNIKAGENSNVYIKELTVALNSGTLLHISNQNIADFKLWKYGTSTPVKTMSSSQISGDAITFTDLNEQVNANQSVRYYVTASFVKNDASNGKTVKFEVSASTVEDSEGKTVSSITGLPLVSGRLITLQGTGTLTNTMDNDNPATKDNTYQIAGSQDVAVASVKMKATNEPVKITKMSVIADGNATTLNNLVNNINEIGIYDGSTRIAYTNNIGVTSTMSGISFVVPTSEKTYTIKVKLNEYGLNKTAVLNTDVRFALLVDEAQGDMSGDPVSAPAQTGWSKYMALTPAKVSAVSMVSSWSGINIVSHLSSGQTQNAAIIKVTAPNFGNNTDSTGGEMKTLIDAIQLNLVGDYATSSPYVSIERIGGSGNATSTTTITGDYAVLDLSSMADSDRAITSGQDAYFLVKVKTATWDGSTNPGTKSLTVNLDKLNGTSGAGNYSFMWMAKDGTDKYDLRIPGVTKVDGIQISN